MEILRQALQIIVALGLLNVWLLRAGKATPYRGGDANSMREEFEAYGLPVAMMYVVGGLKILIALALLAGVWMSALVVPAAAVLIVLMIGAFTMHLKVKDPMVRAVPALLMLGMAIAITALSQV
jgi:uncharacterized membrane protein YphA (DoxX/SURF4 family)